MYKSSFSRRLFLKGSSLLGGYAATASAFSQANELTNARLANQKSSIGNWEKDQSDLPLFRYIAKPFKQSSVNDFKNPAELLEDDPYFLLGNYRLTSFVHSSGVMRLLSGERAWSKLNEGKDQRPDNKAWLDVTDKEGKSRIDLIGPKGIARDPALCTREFGIGYANFVYQLKHLSVVAHSVWRHRLH